MRTLILSQFDRPQMIARIVLGSISPCLRFSALPPIIRDFVSQFISSRIVSGCSTNFMLTLRALELFKSARIYESRSSKMYLAVSSFRYSRLERRAVAIYIEDSTLTSITSNTSGINFQNT